MKTCKFDGCTKESDAKDYCSSHYARLRRHGDPAGISTYRTAPAKWILEHLDYKDINCLIWPFASHDFGYGQIRIDKKSENVHTIMAVIKLGQRPTLKHEVRHICGNGRLGCVNPTHLTYGTRSENSMDRVEHGTSRRGEESPSVKLSEIDVVKILNYLKGGFSQQQIAIEFGVCQSAISSIYTGRSWSWLTGITPKKSVRPV